MLEEIELIIFWSVALTIFGSNLTMAVVFQRKDKKSPSDYLIITGLVGDAVYGLVLLLFPVIDAPFITFPVKVGIFLVLLTVYLDSTLSLFSLLIIFFLTLNRYVAIVKPFLYKSYFKKTTVLGIITFIITVCVLFFIASSAYPFLILFSYDGNPYRTSRVDQRWSRVIPALGALPELKQSSTRVRDLSTLGVVLKE